MTEKFITKLREIMIANTSLTKVYSPALPQTGDDIACITIQGGNSTNNLCNKVLYNDISFRVLIRGTENDTTSRALCDSVYNYLHLLKDISYTGGYIINIVASSLPIYVGKDENQRILYNITFVAKVR